MSTALHQSKKIILFLRLFFLVASVFLAIYLIRSPAVGVFINRTQNLAYVGSFLAGVFFPSTFTVVPATVTLYILGERHNPIFISLFAALGAMVGDNILLKIIKSELENNLYTFIIPRQTRTLRKIIHTRSFYWIIATIGILIIASPLPDELGISILSLIHFKTKHFFLISFLVNFLGILFITSIARMRY